MLVTQVLDMLSYSQDVCATDIESEVVFGSLDMSCQYAQQWYKVGSFLSVKTVRDSEVLRQGSLVPRPHLSWGKGYGQQAWAKGKEFKCSNQIAALSWSYDFLTIEMEQDESKLSFRRSHNFVVSVWITHMVVLTNRIVGLLQLPHAP